MLQDMKDEGLAFSFIKKALVIHFIVLDRKWQVLQYSGISQCDFIISILKKINELTRKNKKQGLCYISLKSICKHSPKGAMEGKV